MNKKQAGVTLTTAQRVALKNIMDASLAYKVANAIGIQVHTLRAAVGGLTIQRGTASIIGQWLDNGGGKS